MSLWFLHYHTSDNDCEKSNAKQTDQVLLDRTLYKPTVQAIHGSQKSKCCRWGIQYKRGAPRN